MFILKGWERHGGFCYKIDNTPRSFERASSGYYCPPALLTVKNRYLILLVQSTASKSSSTYKKFRVKKKIIFYKQACFKTGINY